jgi:hypothetical protein
MTNGTDTSEKSWINKAMGWHFIVLEVPTSTRQLATQPDCLMMNTKLIIGETFVTQLFPICCRYILRHFVVNYFYPVR